MINLHDIRDTHKFSDTILANLWRISKIEEHRWRKIRINLRFDFPTSDTSYGIGPIQLLGYSYVDGWYTWRIENQINAWTEMGKPMPDLSNIEVGTWDD